MGHQIKEKVEDITIGIESNYTYGGEFSNVPPDLDFRICNIKFSPEAEKAIKEMAIHTIRWENLEGPKVFKFIDIPRGDVPCQPDEPIIVFMGKSNEPEKPQG